MAAASSFVIELSRGALVESRHVIHAVVSDHSGDVQYWGNRHRVTIPRSAIKSIQALPLVRSGAADACDVGREELALACASHSGEQGHVAAVAAWLDRLGLDESDLECGPSVPLGAAARETFLAQGTEPNALLNCCSGKHAGFLTLARHLGVATQGYIEPHSPVQRLVTEAIENLCAVDLSASDPGIDGCGIPTYGLPLENLAYGMAQLVRPGGLSSDWAEACRRVGESARLSWWVSGSDRTEVGIETEACEPVIVKTGAEGVYMAALPNRGLGIALKADDGATRAGDAAIRAILSHLGVVPALDDGIVTELRNKAGNLSGYSRASISAPRTVRIAL